MSEDVRVRTSNKRPHTDILQHAIADLKLLTQQQAARAMGVRSEVVRHLVESGQLVTVQSGITNRGRKIPAHSIRTYYERINR